MNTRAKLHSALIAGAAGALALVVLLGSPVPSASAAPPVVSTAPYPGEVVVVDAGSPASIPLAGSGEPGESITAWALVDGDEYPLCTTTVEASGTWSCLVTEAPDFRGPVTFTNGVEVRELDFGLIHAPHVTTDAGDPSSLTSTQTFDDPTQLVDGSGAPGAIVTVELNGGGGCSATVDPTGLWSCALTTLPTGVGPYTLTVGQSYADAPSQRAFAEPVAFLIGGTTIVGPVVPMPPVIPEPPAVPGPPLAPEPPAQPGSVATEPVAPVAGPPVSGSGDGDASQLGDGGDSGSAGASARRGGGAGEPIDVAGGASGPGGVAEAGAGAGGVTTSQTGAGPAGTGYKILGRASRGGGHSSEQVPGDGSHSPAGAAGRDDATVVADGIPAVPSLVERGGELSGFGLSLATIDDVVGRGPVSALVLGAFVAGVLLLVILPGGLLEATVHDNLPRIRRSRAVRAVFGRVRQPRHGRAAFPRVVRSALGIGTVVAVGALASVAVSPAAGFDPVTVRLFLAFLLASVVVNGVTLTVSAGFARHGLGVRALPAARPTVLVLTVVSVVVSRVVGLEPGFVFGAVISLHIGAALSVRRSARLVVVSTSALLALGVAAWLAQNALRDGAVQAGAASHPDAFTALLLDSATAVTVCALSGPIVSLLPLRFLDGQALFRHSKAGWITLYVIAVGAFGFVLLPLPDAWSAIGGDQLLWFAALAAFALLSLGVWAWFRFVPERAPSPASAVAPAENTGRDPDSGRSTARVADHARDAVR